MVALEEGLDGEKGGGNGGKRWVGEGTGLVGLKVTCCGVRRAWVMAGCDSVLFIIRLIFPWLFTSVQSKRSR